jgi:hypothetical protein
MDSSLQKSPFHGEEGPQHPVGWYRTLEENYARYYLGFPDNPSKGDEWTAEDGSRWTYQLNTQWWDITHGAEGGTIEDGLVRSKILDFEEIALYSNLCPIEVSRSGELQPCDKPTIALRYVDAYDGTHHATPVCVNHCRKGEMVNLSRILERPGA